MAAVRDSKDGSKAYTRVLMLSLIHILPNRFCLLGSVLNPLKSPLTTYNTAQGGFDGVLREILQKKFSLCPTTGKFEKCQTTNYVISKYFTVVVIIQKSVYNYGVQEKRFRVIKWEQPYFCYFPQNKQRNATHLLSYS